MLMRPLQVQDPIRTTFKGLSVGNAGRGWETANSSFGLDWSSCLWLLARLQDPSGIVSHLYVSVDYSGERAQVFHRVSNGTHDLPIVQYQ